MIDEQKPRLEVHYPWAAVGINVTRMLADLMHLTDGTFATQKHTWWCVSSSHTSTPSGITNSPRMTVICADVTQWSQTSSIAHRRRVGLCSFALGLTTN